jgi:hypothetical protein
MALSVWYTFENIVLLNQVDMVGDAQYYFSGAVRLLETGSSDVLYPLYSGFLSLFLPLGGPLVARLGQVCLLTIVVGLVLWTVTLKTDSVEALRYAAVSVVLNGGLYVIAVVFYRDLLITLCYVAVCALVSYLTIRRRVASKVVWPNLLALAALIAALLVLWHLSQWSSAMLISISSMAILGSMVPRSRHPYQKYAASLALLIAIGLTVAYVRSSTYVNTAVRSIFMQGARLDELASQGVTIAALETSPVLAVARFVLGPGLVRPLLGERFFLVTTPTISALTAVAVMVWYGQLVVLAPRLLAAVAAHARQWKSVWFIGATMVLYAVIYGLAAGGTGQIRKRILMYLLFTGFTAVAGSLALVGRQEHPDRGSTMSSHQVIVLCIRVLIIAVLVFAQFRAM